MKSLTGIFFLLAVALASDIAVIDQRTTDGFVHADDPLTDAALYAASLLPDGSWRDVDYSRGTRANWPAVVHLDRVLLMAKAWYALGRDEALLGAAILPALDHWLLRDDKLRNDNWWWNSVGVQQRFGPACLMLRGALTKDHVTRCSSILKRAGDPTAATGANTLWLAQIAIWDGLLRNDTAAVVAAYRACARETAYTPASDDGIKRDGSFLQHNGQLTTGSYGRGFAVMFVDIFGAAVNTSLTPDAAQRDAFSALYLDGLRWVVTDQGSLDPSTVGRDLVRSGGLAWDGIDGDALRRLTAGWPRQDEFEASLVHGNRVYPAGDYAIHRRPNYMASVRGHSERIATSECINNENRLGLHLGDGAMYVHGPDGGEYDGIFPLWDWNHVPGITVAYGAETLDCGSVSRRSSEVFVGGVSDGSYGIFAMQFASDHLRFKKAWFMFDDEIVVLATDISGDGDVHSVLDSKVLRGDVHSSAYGKGAPMGLGRTTTQAWWLHHDSVGYVFPDNAEAAGVAVHLAATVPRTAEWSLIGADDGATTTRPTFTAWLEHRHPLAYIVVPSATLDAFEPLATLGAVSVAANTARKQVVAHRNLSIAGIVMWEAWETATLTLAHAEWRIYTDHPCVLLVREVGATLHVSVADPTHRLDRVAVHITNLGRGIGSAIAFDLSARDGASHATVWSEDLPGDAAMSSAAAISASAIYRIL